VRRAPEHRTRDPRSGRAPRLARYTPSHRSGPVKYFRREEGGVSQFNYWRDNLLLTWMQARLLLGFVPRLPLLVWRKLRT